MIFTVKSRAKDGSVAEECIEAVNRSECIAKCKAHGIAPISVREASGKTKRIQKDTSTRTTGINSVVKLIVAIVVPVTITAVIWCYIGNNPNSHKASAKEIKKTSIAQSPKGNKSKTVCVDEKKPNEGNSASLETTESATAENEVSDEQTSGNNSGPLQKQIFKSGTEQVISWIFMCPVGSMPPMLPALPENELVNINDILDIPNKINDEDDEKTSLVKETIEAVKSELKRYIKDGGNVQEFLKYYHRKLVEAHERSNLARKELSSIVREHPELAEQFRNEVNEWLKKHETDGIDFTAREKRILNQ
jgi:hypothetical protein